MELKLYVECVTFALCSLTVAECWYVSHDVERGSVKTISQMMVNKIDRPNTTPTVRAICKLAVYFSVFRPFSYPGCQRSSRSPAVRNVRVSSADRRETSGSGS